jgi:hypothetical protein
MYSLCLDEELSLQSAPHASHPARVYAYASALVWRGFAVYDTLAGWTEETPPRHAVKMHSFN